MKNRSVVVRLLFGLALIVCSLQSGYAVIDETYIRKHEDGTEYRAISRSAGVITKEMVDRMFLTAMMREAREIVISGKSIEENQMARILTAKEFDRVEIFCMDRTIIRAVIDALGRYRDAVVPRLALCMATFNLDDITDLAVALRNNTRLRELEIDFVGYHSKIRPAAAEQIIDILPTMNLSRLALKNANMDARIVLLLFNRLVEMRDLRSLNIDKSMAADEKNLIAQIVVDLLPLTQVRELEIEGLIVTPEQYATMLQAGLTRLASSNVFTHEYLVAMLNNFTLQRINHKIMQTNLGWSIDHHSENQKQILTRLFERNRLMALLPRMTIVNLRLLPLALAGVPRFAVPSMPSLQLVSQDSALLKMVRDFVNDDEWFQGIILRGDGSNFENLPADVLGNINRIRVLTNELLLLAQNAGMNQELLNQLPRAAEPILRSGMDMFFGDFGMNQELLNQLPRAAEPTPRNRMEMFGDYCIEYHLV